MEDKKVLTEAYTTNEGDYIWKILRNRDLTSKNKLGEVLSVLKKLNPSLTNIDMIHPGEKIIIPLIITPIINKEPPGDITEIETVSLSDLENIEYYTVSKGDSLIKVINDKYSVPRHKLYNEYLDQLRKLNPDLKNLNNIVPGQKIRLPIYSPTIARGTIEEKPVETKQENAVERPEAKEIGDHLGRIFYPDRRRMHPAGKALYSSENRRAD